MKEKKEGMRGSRHMTDCLASRRAATTAVHEGAARDEQSSRDWEKQHSNKTWAASRRGQSQRVILACPWALGERTPFCRHLGRRE